MQEDDIGAVLAAAAPQTVPAVTDLQHRARTLGRRRRRNRNVLSAGGAGVAVMAVAGAALTFAGGERAGGSPRMSAGAETAAEVTTSSPTGTTGTSSAKGTASRIDSVVDAVNALLPKGDVVKEVSTSSAGGRKFATDLIVAMPSGAFFTMTVSTSAATGGEGRTCPEGITCTTGSAQVSGHEAEWSYYERFGSPPSAKPTGSSPTSETGAGPFVEGLTILDPVGGHRIDVVSTGTDRSSTLKMDELKSIGLNDRFVSAVLATVR